MKESGYHRSTSRVLDALELISESGKGGYTLTEICQIMDVPKSSMFPILHTLEKRHYLSANSVSGKYTIGPSAFQLGNAYLENFDMLREIQTELQNITNVCAEASYFATLKGGEAFYLAKADSPEPIRMVASLGNGLPAYSTGIGKALLMDHTLSDLKRLYPDGLQPLTEHTVTDFRILCEQLQEAHETGFCYEVEESNQYIRCFAVPLRKNGAIIAAVSVAIPVFRYTEEKEDFIKHLLKNAQKRLECLFQNVTIDFTHLS